MNRCAPSHPHPNEPTSFLSYNSLKLNFLSHKTFFYSHIIRIRLNHCHNPHPSPNEVFVCILKTVSKDFITILITCLIAIIITMDTNLLPIRYHSSHYPCLIPLSSSLSFPISFLSIKLPYSYSSHSSSFVPFQSSSASIPSFACTFTFLSIISATFRTL